MKNYYAIVSSDDGTRVTDVLTENLSRDQACHHLVGS